MPAACNMFGAAIGSKCAKCPSTRSLIRQSTPQLKRIHVPHQITAAPCTSFSRRGSQQIVHARPRGIVIPPDILIGKGEEMESFDLYEYLLRQRIIFITEYINDKVATKIVASLLALEQIDEEADIRIYINSGGGSPYSIWGVLDVMQSIKPDIQTVGFGACYSYATTILGAGTKGKRFAMKNCRMMLTMPMGGSEGSFFQIERTVQELNALYQMYLCYLKKFTNLNWLELEEATSRDLFITPEEGVDIGLLDGVIKGENDSSLPPAKARQWDLLGMDPPFNPGVGSAGVAGWTGRIG